MRAERCKVPKFTLTQAVEHSEAKCQAIPLTGNQPVAAGFEVICKDTCGTTAMRISLRKRFYVFRTYLPNCARAASSGALETLISPA